MTNPLIASLTRAVEAAPDDVALRLHLAELLLAEGDVDAAVGHCASALQRDPANAQARVIMGRALGGIPTPAAPTAPTDPTPPTTDSASAPAPSVPTSTSVAQSGEHHTFDWAAAESEVKDRLLPSRCSSASGAPEPVIDAWDAETLD
ncbi:MAG: tetratricopeptide repeat protein [Dermatophilaceae bacterium]